MCDVLVFAGTKEGRRLWEFCRRKEVDACFYVATAYGERLLAEAGSETKGPLSPQVKAGRLDAAAMEREICQQQPRYVVDATHPYAQEATAAIRTACERAGVSCLRLVREALPDNDSELARLTAGAVWVESAEEAAAFLQNRQGRILLTTGSKELSSFLGLSDYENRLFVRILPDEANLHTVREAGISLSHVAAMQGPFSSEINYALLKEWRIAWLVTKEAGAAGGFREKLQAAERAGAGCMVIRRPTEEKGYCLAEIEGLLQTLAKGNAEASSGEAPEKRRVWLIGAGPGKAALLTEEAKEVLLRAELVIGAGRLLQELPLLPTQERQARWEPESVRQAIAESDCERAAVVFSGDSGFYSGAGGLAALLAGDGAAVTMLPGISSLSYLSAKSGISWEDACLISLHGRQANLAAAVKSHRKTFSLLSGNAAEALDVLIQAGITGCHVILGLSLSYPWERILSGSPEEVKTALLEVVPEEKSLGALFVLQPENAGLLPVSPVGWPEERFVRGKVPITKAEVRAISLSRLALFEDAVVYDVGAGSGSVSVEMAHGVCRGRVYAIEEKEEALSLIARNRQRYQLKNLEIVEGSAPDCFVGLPRPDAAFVGGSHGRLPEILEALLQKNPGLRLVINVISLQTLNQALSFLEAYRKRRPGRLEVVQAGIARGEAVESHLLLKGQNPVFILCWQGEAEAHL